MLCAYVTNPDFQNSYFEVFTQELEVTNLFVWKFKGELVHAQINFLCSWHDSRLAASSGLYYLKISDYVAPPGYSIFWDSAFIKEIKGGHSKFVRARKQNEKDDNLGAEELDAIDLLLEKAMSSERQSTEWAWGQ